MIHAYTINRKLWTDKRGFSRMSDYWQIRCDPCHWRGERITVPSSRQSKDRYDEWRAHVATN